MLIEHDPKKESNLVDLEASYVIREQQLGIR